MLLFRFHFQKTKPETLDSLVKFSQVKDGVSKLQRAFNPTTLQQTSQLQQTSRQLCNKILIAPKASAEGACIFSKLGYYGACMMGYYDCALRVTMERVWWVTMERV